MLDALDEQNVEAEKPRPWRRSTSRSGVRAEGIDNAEGKQQIITELYEKFFKTAFPRDRRRRSASSTPRSRSSTSSCAASSTSWRRSSACRLSDEGVHVLDPFTGTGTFIVRLLQSGLIRPEDLLRKYTHELHANEIVLLAYYIAAVNIEATYHGLTAQDDAAAGYVPFDGIVLTDTFQHDRRRRLRRRPGVPRRTASAQSRRRALDIRVIIGNPPYSVGQTSGNDNNENLKYPPSTRASRAPTRRSRRRPTRTRCTTPTSARSAGPATASRTRASSASSPTAASSTATPPTASARRLADEFTSIYVFNLRGNQRTAGELSRKEGGKIFGGGSREHRRHHVPRQEPGQARACRDPLPGHRRLPEPRGEARTCSGSSGMSTT